VTFLCALVLVLTRRPLQPRQAGPREFSEEAGAAMKPGEELVLGDKALEQRSVGCCVLCPHWFGVLSLAS